MSSGHSDTTTEGIRIRVAAQYLPGESDPAISQYMYTYRVIISNGGEQGAKLVGRHWVIRDADNELREVRGSGVVGQQPDLPPGESFEYESRCPLATEWGTMEGAFSMSRPDGEHFEATIGRFFLAPTAAPISQL